MGQHNKRNIEQNEKKSPFVELCANKKITNHFARKTTVRKLKSFGFLKCEIKNITGHSSERGLDPYDFGDKDRMFTMSLAISKSNYSTSTAAARQADERNKGVIFKYCVPLTDCIDKIISYTNIFI